MALNRSENHIVERAVLKKGLDGAAAYGGRRWMGRIPRVLRGRDAGQLQRMLVHPFGVQDEFELAQTRETWSRMAEVLVEYLEEA